MFLLYYIVFVMLRFSITCMWTYITNNHGFELVISEYEYKIIFGRVYRKIEWKIEVITWKVLQSPLW